MWEHVPYDDALLADLNWIGSSGFGYSADSCSPPREVIASKVDSPEVAAAVLMDIFLDPAQLKAFNIPETEPSVNKADNINPSPPYVFSAPPREWRHLIRPAARVGQVLIVLTLGSALARSS